MIKKAKIQRKIRREISNITDRYEKGLCKRSLEGWRREIERRKEKKRGKEDGKAEENEEKKTKIEQKQEVIEKLNQKEKSKEMQKKRKTKERGGKRKEWKKEDKIIYVGKCKIWSNQYKEIKMELEEKRILRKIKG